MSVFGRHIHLLAALHERVFLQPVGNEVADGNQFHVVLLGKLGELRQSCHRTVLVHNLHQGTHGAQSCQSAEIHGSLRVSGALQHAVVLCIERVDVSGTAEGLRCRFRIGECTDGGGAVIGRHTGGASFQFIDGDGERCTQHGGVVHHLMREVEFLAAFLCHGYTEHAACLFQHEVHHFGGDLLCGADKVALVLAVFVVHHDDKLTFPEVIKGFLYPVQFNFIH